MASGGENFSEQSALWLSQGDIFERVPLVELDYVGDRLQPRIFVGPAMLIDHSCALDKRDKAERPVIDRLTFLPVRDVNQLPNGKMTALKNQAWSFTPYNLMYLGGLNGVGESFVNLAEGFSIPVTYFGVYLHDFDYQVDADCTHLVPSRHDTRTCRLKETSIELFKSKWNAHWTRRLPG